MSSRELSEWMAFAREEPIGEHRADLRTGILASLIANANRDPKKRHKPFTASDFMPEFWDRGGAEQDWTDQLMIIETLNMAFGGQDLRPDRRSSEDGEA